MPPASATSKAGHYATVWRWHFYAALFTAPFLLILSVTGAIYLFNDELNDAIYPELRFAPAAGEAMPVSHWVAAAVAAYPGANVTEVNLPAAPGRSAELFVSGPNLAERRVFIDPVSARVLGSYVYTETLVGWADVMHGFLHLGTFGNYVVELAASWAVVLVGTGLYLWWPRGRTKLDTALASAVAMGRRSFWRRWHRTTGISSAALILFLLVTGLPWSGFWGNRWLAPASNALGLGYPLGTRTQDAIASRTVVQVLGKAPWALEQAPMPCSTAHHGTAPLAETSTASASDIGIDAAARIFNARGLTAYWLFLPDSPEGVYTAYTYPARPEGQHTIHLDRYTGEVLREVRFADYGAVAKLVEWGVALHLGNYFGRANQIVMLIPCLAIIGLVVSGFTMWWKRRSSGGLGLPKSTAALPPRNALIFVVALCVFLPLAGASFLVVFACDRLLRTFRRDRSNQLP